MPTAVSATAGSMDAVISHAMLGKICMRIAEHAFCACTKVKHNEKFNCVKTLASDQTNIAFRTQIQTGCNVQKGKSNASTNKPNFNHIRKELGMKLEQQ